MNNFKNDCGPLGLFPVFFPVLLPHGDPVTPGVRTDAGPLSFFFPAA